MEPISFGLGLLGSAVGAFTSYEASKKINQSQQAQFGLQQQVEGQRRQAMMLKDRRDQLENLRNVQRARATALTNATSEGAQSGSGLQGGFAQVMGQGSWNSVGMSLNLGIGENIFDLNSQITDQKLLQSQAQQQMSLGQGISSFGSSLMGASPGIGRLTSGFGDNRAPKPYG